MTAAAAPADDVVLAADVGCRRGGFRVDAAFTIREGTLTALVGPNGSGKSTVLRALAGLLPMDRGTVTLDRKLLADPSSGTHVRVEERPISLVFQDHLLFPRMSARDNVAFGLRARGMTKAAARSRADLLLGSMGLTDRASARATQLSGGEAQRVALARARAVSPRLLLLDEPFAAMDQHVRASMRADLKAHVSADSGATLLVSHDPLDVLVLADEVVVLEEGRIAQTGTPAELANRPRTDYVARLAGLNLLRGRARGMHADVGRAVVALDAAYDGEVFIAIRPTSIAVHRVQPEGSPRNVWPATVGSVELHGDQVRLTTLGPVALRADVTRSAAAELGLNPGLPVWLSVKATEVTAYPA
ncbi:MAG: ABC transporter ATP-binding protein [Mycobacteriales bacterium]